MRLLGRKEVTSELEKLAYDCREQMDIFEMGVLLATGIPKEARSKRLPLGHLGSQHWKSDHAR